MDLIPMMGYNTHVPQWHEPEKWIPSHCCEQSRVRINLSERSIMSNTTPQFLVYKITNIVNGKSYIGVTTRDVVSRWKEHVYEASTLRRNFAFHSAIRKYGAESFSVEVIHSCVDIDEMLDIERSLVSGMGTLVPNGYNSAPGGRAGRGAYGPMSEGQRLSISKAWGAKSPEDMMEFSRKMKDVASKRSESAEYRKKLSIANTGKKLTEWAREKIRTARAKQVFSPEVIKRRADKLRGRTHGAVSIANMSASQKGRLITKEHAEKISKTLRRLQAADAAVIKFDVWGWQSKEYAEHFKISPQVVCDIRKGRTYKDVTRGDLP